MKRIILWILSLFRKRPSSATSGAVTGSVVGAGAVALIVSLTTPMVRQHEGLRTDAYLDPVGVPTICFGETRGVHLGQTRTVAECEEMLRPRLVGFLQEMRSCTRIPGGITLPPKTESAFLSFTYNVGSGLYCRNIAEMRLNKGNLVEACQALNLYVKAGRPLRVLRGLVNRRAEESALCMEGLREAGLTGSQR